MNTIKTLLLTGENNHDWQRTSPFFKHLLEDTAKFSVDLAENPSEILEGDLSGYSLFFLDYNGPEWSERAQANFLDAVRDGTGVVVLHAANNAFENWAEYAAMVGHVWRDEAGSGHGEFHRFAVRIVVPGHPITNGLQDFATEDELYHGLMSVPGAPAEILAEAYSDAQSGGSGRLEPILMASRYGAGRVFHTALGHVWPGDPEGTYRGATMVAVESAGFQKTLLRGCEWAATGNVAEELG